MVSISEGCRFILIKLLNQNRIGGKNIPERICISWIKHLSRTAFRTAVNDSGDCIREGLILTKPKPSERYISINPRKLKEVWELIKK